MNRSYILVRNVVYNFISQFWFLILAFITIPYIVHKLGTDAYGVLSLVGVVLGYFAFLNLGLGPAVIKYISEYYAKKDYQAIRKVIGSALTFYLLMGFAGAFLIASLTSILVTKLLHIPPHLIKVSSFAFYIAALGFLVNMPLNVFGAIPQALQRFDISNKISISMGTLSIGFTVFLLYLGFHLKEIVILNLMISLISIIIHIIVVKRLLPQISLRPSFDLPVFFSLFRFGGFILIAQSMGTIVLQVDKLLIGLFLPISYLTFYVIPFSLSQKLLTVQGIISPVVFPAISELSSSGQKKLIKELYLRSTRFIVTATLPLSILLVVFARPLLSFWLGSDFALKGTLPLQILALGFFINGLAGLPSVVLQGIGQPKIHAKFTVFVAAIILFLWLFLIPWLGINGAALAFLVSQSIIVPPYIMLVNRTINVANKKLLNKSFLRPISVAILLFLPLFSIRDKVTGLISLIPLMTSAYLVYFIFAYFVVFDQKDRQTLLQYLKKKNV